MPKKHYLFGPNPMQLLSSEINKVDLVATDVLFQHHRNLKGESRAGTLAVKLAREVYFGSQVMSKCTMSGCWDLPGLPTAELGELKQTLFLQFPEFWKNPVEFEALWSKCVEAINQSCKKIRQTQYSAVFNISHYTRHHFSLLFFLSVIIVIIHYPYN